MDIQSLTFEQVRKLDTDQAREILEQIRWPNGPTCHHCGSVEAYKIQGKATSKKPARKGLYKCKHCRKQFTVTTNTIFSDSHIPLDKWLMAIYLMCSSKKGISAHQLHRTLEITYKSAWFMAHRIRYAMGQKPLADMLSGTVEVDETYIGGKSKGKRGRGAVNKTPVVSLIERNGRKRSFKLERVNANSLKAVIRSEVAKESSIMTDSFKSYTGLNTEFGSHEVVNHGLKEYVRGNAHVNTCESSFALLKRGIHGSFHHVSTKHLDRYLDEFDFRWDSRKGTDAERTVKAIAQTEGKRLKYKDK